jgi:hypothetical protein
LLGCVNAAAQAVPLIKVTMPHILSLLSPLPLCPAVSFTLVSLLLPPSYSLAKPQLLPVESFIHLFIQVWRASLYRLVLHLDRPCIIYNVSKAKNRIIFSGPSHPTGHMGLDY